MTSITKNIREILVTAAVGANGSTSPTASFSIHVSKLPASPDAVIAVMRAGGLQPNPKWLVDYPAIQVIVRGKANGHDDAEDKAQEVKDALLGIPSQDINGDRLVQINMIGDIAPLGYDDKNRPLFSLNFQAIVEPASGTNRLAL